MMSLSVAPGLNAAGEGAVKTDDVLVRALTEDDLDQADRIFRVAFGTFLGSKNRSDSPGTPISCARAGWPIRRLCWPPNWTAA
jgi:hypothetical protein